MKKLNPLVKKGFDETGLSQSQADALYQPLEDQRLSTTDGPTFSGADLNGLVSIDYGIYTGYDDVCNLINDPDGVVSSPLHLYRDTTADTDITNLITWCRNTNDPKGGGFILNRPHFDWLGSTSELKLFNSALTINSGDLTLNSGDLTLTGSITTNNGNVNAGTGILTGVGSGITGLKPINIGGATGTDLVFGGSSNTVDMIFNKALGIGGGYTVGGYQQLPALNSIKAIPEVISSSILFKVTNNSNIVERWYGTGDFLTLGLRKGDVFRTYGLSVDVSRRITNITSTQITLDTNITFSETSPAFCWAKFERPTIDIQNSLGDVYFKIDQAGNATFNNTVKLAYLSGAPATLVNGMCWMESDGLHIYYNSSEKVVAGV